MPLLSFIVSCQGFADHFDSLRNNYNQPPFGISTLKAQTFSGSIEPKRGEIRRAQERNSLMADHSKMKTDGMRRPVSGGMR